MTVRLADCRVAAVEAVTIRELDEPEPTFNIEVEGTHNYFAGANHVLVHNGPVPGYMRARDFIVYVSKDGLYVGRTRVDLPYRYGVKNAQNYDILQRGLTYSEARGLEQHYIDKFRAEGRKLRNVKNGIDPNRTDRTAMPYRKAAKAYMDRPNGF